MSSENNIETLKYILQNSLHPEVLNSHAWTKSLIVDEAIKDNPGLESKTAGQQLVITITDYFTQITPETPPMRGKKVDARWGEFGILAAQYFAPLIFGTPSPASLQDAEKYINESILLFVFGKSGASISKEKINAYKLIGAKTENPAGNTLDLWHKGGLQQLEETLAAREGFLSKSFNMPAVIANSATSQKRITRTNAKSKSKPFNRNRFIFSMTAIFIFLVLLTFGGFKAYRIYNLSLVVQKDVAFIQNLLTEPDVRLGRFKNIGSAVSILRKDFSALKNETQPFFWVGPFLQGVPVHGGDLTSIQDLTTLVDSLLISADLSYQSLSPLVEEGALSAVNPAQLTKFLKDDQTQLKRAQQALKQAQAARARLNIEILSPTIRDLIINDADPIMKLMQDGLTVAVELPRIMGAGDEGVKNYLLLVQNEDELRPTGGFITAASAIRMQDGNIGDLSFVNSGDLDNWNKIYPAAPWQLKEYMNSQVLIFRDANWFTNYPTTAQYAKYLYAYTDDRAIDGVIAFDQHLLVEILNVTGPLEIEDAPFPIDSSNIAEYMRESKTPNAQEAASPNWNNKAFLNKITFALIEKMLSGEVKWELASAALMRALNEHHLLLQVDNPDMTALLARYHWDGSIQPGTGDFLMAVDTNVGFNKTNAVVESSAAYDVDLTDPTNIIGSLTITRKNNAKKSMVCKQWLKDHLEGEEGYPITDCYWNYLRVYMAAGTALISATPQSVPDIWMINKQKKAGQVDILNEDIKGVQAFGTLQVVPSGESYSTNFQFSLPANVLQGDAKRMQYTLKVQKQPGTLAAPFTIRVHFANNAVIETAPSGTVIQDYNVLYNTNLKTDIEFSVIFSVR